MNIKQQRKGGQPSSLFRLLFLALFFFFGVLLGQVLANQMPDEVRTDLDRYLSDFFRMDTVTHSSPTVLSTMLLYVRYPLAAFLLGFSSAGVLFLPLLSALFGLFLSFSVSCLCAVYQCGGLLLAFAALGLRCILTLPCYFFLAVPALNTSCALVLFSRGKGRRTVSVVYGKQYWLRLAVVFWVLFFAVCLELMLAPWLLQMALQKVLV